GHGDHGIDSTAVILVGERLATSPGALSAAAEVAAKTGARLAWVPRRAGDRGAVETGCLPNLLPGGRPVADAAARVDAGAAWGVESLPAQPGRDVEGILAAAAAGELGGLVVGGVDPYDLSDPQAALQAVRAAGFVVSIELRASAVTPLADVVLPVAPAVEKAGTFLDWEGRARPFEAVLRSSNAMSDARVLHVLAAEMGVALGTPDAATARAEIAELGRWEGERPAAPSVPASEPVVPAAGQAVLATWHQLLDLGRLQEGDPYLAGTSHAVVARLSAATAAEVGVPDGGLVTVSTDRGAVTVPLVVTEMPDRVVWLPTNSRGSQLRRSLAADVGSLVRLAPAETAPAPTGATAQQEASA
ncbi:MAG: molybdopterin dinucleotide binding domain-containing protein, partial [Motilibacteraceae bacterium]